MSLSYICAETKNIFVKYEFVKGVKFVKVVKVQGGHLMVVKVVTLKVMDTLMVVKAPLISAPATCPQLPTASPPPEARGRTPGTMPRTTRKTKNTKRR